MITQTLLNVLVSDINTALEATGTQERLRLSFDKNKTSIERIMRTDKDRHHVDSKFILLDASFSEAHHYLVGFQNSLSFIPTIVGTPVRATFKDWTGNYYHEQIAKIGNPRTGYAPQVQFNGTDGRSKWLSLNDESASVIVKFLTDNYNIS